MEPYRLITLARGLEHWRSCGYDWKTLSNTDTLANAR
jgi:hypothetical protein